METQSFSRPGGTGERPRLNLNPPKPSAQATELHDNISKPKGSFENPFGAAAVSIDHKKMDDLEKERLRKEMDRDRRERERREEAFRNQQQQRVQRPQTPRDNESKTAASWRNNKPAPGGGNPPPVQRSNQGEAPIKPKKQVDDDGWISKVKIPRGEVEETFAPAPKQPEIPSKKPVGKKTDIDASNIFSTLSEVND